MPEKIKLSKETEAEANQPLPRELDNETVIFSYGSLLDHQKLRALLTGRGEFKILETNNAAQAARLVQENPKDIVILKNVLLENVRVSIVTETILRRWYKKRGGDLEELISAGITPRETPPALFLYGRVARPTEKGKFLSGGLIFNLSKAELSVLDKYEWKPVLERALAPKLIIGEHIFIPEYITFYAGTESAGDLTPDEKAERSKLLNLNRKPGHQSPQAKWQRSVRHREMS